MTANTSPATAVNTRSFMVLQNITRTMTVVLQKEHRDIHLTGHLIDLAIIFPFGLHIVRRVDQKHGGFTAHTPFGMAFPVFRMRIIGVQPVEQFMGKRASFLHVGHMLVDDYGLVSLTVEA